MDFLIIAIASCVFLSLVTDIHSVDYEVQGLVRFENSLITSLEDYFKRQEKNDVTFDSEITSFVKDLHLKNEVFSSKPSTQFENPISKYHVTKRLVKDWSVVKDNLTCLGQECPLLTGEDVFKAVFKREKRVLPTDNDLETAALTLLDIWDIYDLDLEQLVKGKIRDIQGERLSADDIFFVASTARDARKYYGAIKWFEYLLFMVRNGDIKASFRKQNLYRKLAASYQEYGMSNKAIEILESYKEEDPENTAVAADLKYYKSFDRLDKTELKRFEDTKDEKDSEDYRKLCQASLQVTQSSKRLHCYIQPMFGAYGVSRQEELSLRPKIILIYDFISDNETNVLWKYADKDWQAQKTPQEISFRPDLKEKANGWFCERRSGTPFLDVLSHRIEAITQLKVWPFHGIHSSECYRFRRNRIGAKNTVTQDYWNKEDAKSRPDAVNRYATIRLQLTSTMLGGATLFPKIGLHIPNIKNSAVIWWNLRDNGNPNLKSQHIDCPIICGVNRVLSKTVFYRNQVNTRKSTRR